MTNLLFYFYQNLINDVFLATYVIFFVWGIIFDNCIIFLVLFFNFIILILFYIIIPPLKRRYMYINHGY